MKSSVFTTKDPFPPPPTQRSWYHPSHRHNLKQKRGSKKTSSPVRPSQPASPLSTGPIPGPACRQTPAEDHKTFRESWPSTDLETTLPSNMDPPAPSVSTRGSNVSAQWRHQQDSLLAKYVERFRYGGPRSRAERPPLSSAVREEEEEQHQPFWWMSPPSSPTPPPHAGHMDDITALTEAPAPDSELLDVSASDLSDCSLGDTEALQETASRLLHKSQSSLCVSSEGLGSSDWSSPVSVDEPARKPLFTNLMGSTVYQLSSASTTVGTTSSSSFSRPHPENDILFQWRLRRKMEQARQRPWVLSEQPPGLQRPRALSEQPPGLQGPQTLSGQPPVLQGPWALSEQPPGLQRPRTLAEQPPGLQGLWALSEQLPVLQGPRALSEQPPVLQWPQTLSGHPPGLQGPQTLSEQPLGLQGPRALSEQPPRLQWPQTLSGHSPGLQGPWALSEQPPGLQGPQSVWQSPGLQQPSVHQKRIQEPEPIVFPISKLGSKEMPKLCLPAAGTTTTPLPHPGPRQTVSRPQVAMVPLLNDGSSPPTQQKAIVPPKHSKAVSNSAAENSLEAAVGEPEACPSTGSAQEQRSRETNRPAEDKSSNRKQKTRSTRRPAAGGPGGHTVSASPHSPGEVLAPAPHKLSHNKDQRQMNSQALNQEVCSAPSPVHQAVREAVSQVLFPQGFSTRGCSLPAPAPPPGPGPGAGRQKAMEVVSQLLWEAEDSDGDEFENDVLLQVLRNQRLWVQEQLSQVDSLLVKLQQEGEVGTT